MLTKIVLMGLAGGIGTLARYALSGWIARRAGETFPLGTLVVNLAGCFLIGLLFHLFEERFLVDPLLRVVILAGFLGGFTTFSSFGLQSFTLLRDGQVFLAGLNIFVSNLAGLFCVWAGYQLARGI